MAKAQEAHRQPRRVDGRETARAAQGAAAPTAHTSPPLPFTRRTSRHGTADGPLDAASTDPHQLHRMNIEAHREAEDRLLMLGALLKVMQDTEAYRDLGHESFTEYLAQPELGMHKSWAYAVMQAAELVQATGLNPQDVSGVEVTKLAMVSRKALKALEGGDRDAAVALIQEAKVLGRSDLRAKLHENGDHADEREDDSRSIQKLLVETLLGRPIKAVKYDGYTFTLLTPGLAKGLQQQVRVYAPAGQRVLVKMGSL